MTMLEKYLMKLFTFTLYFIIIYLNVTAVNALVKRKLFQKRAEWDDNSIFKECHDPHDKSKPCDKQDWSLDEDYQFTSDVIKTQSNLLLDDCFNLCWKETNCYAISREKSGSKTCILLGKNYKRNKDKRYNSYIARCCTLKDSPAPTKSPQAPCKTDLPVIFNEANVCNANSFTLGSFWWDMQENVISTHSPYTNKTNTNILSCQRQCAQYSKCMAVSVQWNNVNVCYFYNESKAVSIKKGINIANNIFFLKNKCILQNKILLKYRKADLMIVYDYQPFCQQISELKLEKKCDSLLWHFVNESKFVSDQNNAFNLVTIQQCLNQCLKSSADDDCYAVSVDHSQRKCYIHTGFNKANRKTLPQTSWSSYKLQCCDKPKVQ